MDFFSFRFKNIFKPLGAVGRYERLKVVFLSSSFFLVIGAYTIVKELKDSIFLNIVGLEYLPWAKLISMVILLPMVFLYAKLVDLLHRSHLVYFYAILYGLGGLFFAYFLGHSTIGLVNTDSSPYRLFGWLFYFFIEGYSPFVVSLLWAFMNSITKPESVKNSYIVVAASAKAGGAVMAGFAWWFLYVAACGNSCFSDVGSYQFLLIFSSILLLVVPLVIASMIRKVPESYLHGYEASYKSEKKQGSSGSDSAGFIGSIKSMFSGLYLIVRYPYVMGIFGMIFFWEIINVIFNFLRLGTGHKATESIAGFGMFLFQQACFTQVVIFFFVLFGTRTIVTWIGERRSLIAVPLMIGGIVAYYLFMQSLAAASLAYIVMRVINYAFAYPLRESLYIPTTKAMRFKSKSWIDGFGAKLSKGVGSYYNLLIQGVASVSVVSVNIVFFGVVIALWVVMAHFLGRRFESVIKNNEVVGSED